MRAFDFDQAKAGAAVCTRSGKRVKLYFFNELSNSRQPIVAVFENNRTETFGKDGRYNEYINSEFDLVMADK